MQLHFQCHGDGVPLIILHGLLGSLDNWQTISRKLGERYRVCALDLRNHGRSPHSDVFDYRAMGDDVLEFMASQGMQSAHLLGHSMGGKAAMHFALWHPERVEKLIVVDIAPRGYAPSHVPIFEALLSLDLAAFRERGEIDAALAPRIPQMAVRQFLLKNVGRDEQGAFRWKPNLQALYQNYDGIRAAIETSGHFQGPALFIRGGKSNYVNDEDREMIGQLFPKATVATIPETGHWVQAEAPGKFTEMVAEFLG